MTANYLCNRSPTGSLEKTPWETFYGVVPVVSHLRTFGAKAYVQVPQHLRKKLDPRSKSGVFIGYEANSKAYRILMGDTKRVKISMEVLFDESSTKQGVATAKEGEESIMLVLKEDAAGPGAAGPQDHG
jgi:hypothetical protein